MKTVPPHPFKKADLGKNIKSITRIFIQIADLRSKILFDYNSHRSSATGA